jgi:hypothetical protein
MHEGKESQDTLLTAGLYSGILKVELPSWEQERIGKMIVHKAIEYIGWIAYRCTCGGIHVQ